MQRTPPASIFELVPRPEWLPILILNAVRGGHVGAFSEWRTIQTKVPLAILRSPL